MAALDIGGRPKLAFYATNGGDMLSFVNGGYAEKIKDWKALLAEIHPGVKSGKVDPPKMAAMMEKNTASEMFLPAWTREECVGRCTRPGKSMSSVKIAVSVTSA